MAKGRENAKSGDVHGREFGYRWVAVGRGCRRRGILSYGNIQKPVPMLQIQVAQSGEVVAAPAGIGAPRRSYSASSCTENLRGAAQLVE